MAVIYPFQALRPVKQNATEVASVPYDVVSTEEARALTTANPLSFLHVSRPEVDLPPGTNIYSDEVYEQAANNFRTLSEACPLEMDDAPALYIYRLRMGQHTQTGIAACCVVDEYDSDLIRKHERTRPDKEDDRTRHILALRAQTGPVFLTYRSDRRIDALVTGVATASTDSLYDFTAEDGISHTIWRAPDTAAPLVRAFREVPLLYIADGHHRAAGASRARASLRKQNAQHTGEENYNRFLAVIFPDNQMQILPYNRIVRDLGGLSVDDFLAQLAQRFRFTEGASPVPAEQGECSMYLSGKWYGLSLAGDGERPQSVAATATASLDVQLLQDKVLGAILGIRDVRTDKRIDFIGGARGSGELERLVDAGKAAVAFSLHPTTIDDLLRVADAGEIMPPKSTWFEPKLRDGLLIHCI